MCVCGGGCIPIRAEEKGTRAAHNSRVRHRGRRTNQPHEEAFPISKDCGSRRGHTHSLALCPFILTKFLSSLNKGNIQSGSRRMNQLSTALPFSSAPRFFLAPRRPPPGFVVLVCFSCKKLGVLSVCPCLVGIRSRMPCVLNKLWATSDMTLPDYPRSALMHTAAA